MHAKAVLLQRMLDIHRSTRMSTGTAAADEEWLAGTCRIPMHLVARADALVAHTDFQTNARAEALSKAQVEDEAHVFMMQAAGPQHLSRKQSPELGTWLTTCPGLKNKDAVAIRVCISMYHPASLHAPVPDSLVMAPVGIPASASTYRGKGRVWPGRSREKPR